MTETRGPVNFQGGPAEVVEVWFIGGAKVSPEMEPVIGARLRYPRRTTKQNADHVTQGLTTLASCDVMFNAFKNIRVCIL